MSLDEVGEAGGEAGGGEVAGGEVAAKLVSERVEREVAAEVASKGVAREVAAEVERAVEAEAVSIRSGRSKIKRSGRRSSIKRKDRRSSMKSRSRRINSSSSRDFAIRIHCSSLNISFPGQGVETLPVLRIFNTEPRSFIVPVLKITKKKLNSYYLKCIV